MLYEIYEGCWRPLGWPSDERRGGRRATEEGRGRGASQTPKQGHRTGPQSRIRDHLKTGLKKLSIVGWDARMRRWAQRSVRRRSWGPRTLRPRRSHASMVSNPSIQAPASLDGRDQSELNPHICPRAQHGIRRRSWRAATPPVRMFSCAGARRSSTATLGPSPLLSAQPLLLFPSGPNPKTVSNTGPAHPGNPSLTPCQNASLDNRQETGEDYASIVDC